MLAKILLLLLLLLLLLKIVLPDADGRNVCVSYHFPLPLILPTSIKEFKNEPPKQERVDDDDDDDYDEDTNFEEVEARGYGRENVGPVASTYLMHYVVRKDGDMFIIVHSPIVVDTVGDITIKERVFEGSKGLWELLRRKKVNMEFITKMI